MNKKKLCLILTFPIITFIFIIIHTFTSKNVIEPEVNDSDKSIYLGFENYQIECTKLLPDTVITFKSSNELIAEVSAVGLVKPISTGVVDIFINIKQKRKEYNFKVTITICDPYIIISNQISEIIQSESYIFQIEAIGLRKTDIIWSVSDESVGIIGSDTGYFYAKKEGQVIVTAQDRNSGDISVCYVDVTKIPFGIAGKMDEYWCGVSYNLQAKGADAPVIWSVSDREVASINQEGVFFAKKEGRITITVKNTQSGETSSRTVTTKDVQESPSDIFEIGETEEEIIIYGIKDKSYSEIKIPEEINGKMVSYIMWYAFMEQPQLKVVIIPSTVKRTEDETFYRCENLESLIILDRDEQIGFSEYDLSNCINLKEFIAPYNCSIVFGQHMFTNDTSLIEVIIPEGSIFNDEVFYGCHDLDIAIPNSITSLDTNLFIDCERIRITIPETVIEIYEHFISDCKDMIIITPKGSAAENYAKEHNIEYVNY